MVRCERASFLFVELLKLVLPAFLLILLLLSLIIVVGSLIKVLSYGRVVWTFVLAKFVVLIRLPTLRCLIVDVVWLARCGIRFARCGIRLAWSVVRLAWGILLAWTLLLPLLTGSTLLLLQFRSLAVKLRSRLYLFWLCRNKIINYK